MEAFYGFKDGSGDWFLIIDTDKCNGCGQCVEVCPSKLLVVQEDDFDPFSEETLAAVREEERKKLKYHCAPCKPGYGEAPPPCINACEAGAISHTESWKDMYGQRSLSST